MTEPLVPARQLGHGGHDAIVDYVSHHREPVWREIWARRELLRQLVTRDVRLRYHQAVMGFLWALLMPCLVLGASLMVRFLIANRTSLSHANGIAGTAFKAWAWAFFVGSINFTTGSLLTNINLIAKMYFPREVLPLAALGAQSIDAGVGLTFLLVLSPLLGLHFGVQLLWVPLLIGLLFLIILGAALFLSAANVFYRDVKYLVQVAVTFGIFATPVFFGLPDLGARGRMFLIFNPLTTVLEGLSLVTGSGHNLAVTIPAPDGGIPYWSPLYLVAAGLFAFGLLWVAVTFFRLKSDRFSELA